MSRVVSCLVFGGCALFLSLDSRICLAGPYGGVPAPLPGRVQAENYDTGGQNVAYYDDSPGNSGGGYRTDDVDITACYDTDCNPTIGWFNTGEWLKYSVSATQAGTYAMTARIGTGLSGRSFRVEVDGVDASGNVPIPTGTWGTLSSIDVTRTVNLTAGAHTIRFVNVAGAFDFNWLDFRLVSVASGPYGGTPAAIPGRIQAENYDTGGQNVAYYDDSPGNSLGGYRNDDVDITACYDTDCNPTIGSNPSEWLKYTVSVAQAGNYAVTARVGTGLSGKSFRIDIDGTAATGNIAVPVTGWGTLTSVASGSISLTAGSHVLRFFDVAGPFDFNWLDLIRVGATNSIAATPTTRAVEYMRTGGVQLNYSSTSAHAWITQSCNGGAAASVLVNGAPTGTVNSLPAAPDQTCTVRMYGVSPTSTPTPPTLASATFTTFERPDVGANYNVTGGTSLSDNTFITRYDDPAVRSSVLAELHAMVQGGATAIRSPFWFGRHPSQGDTYISNPAAPACASQPTSPSCIPNPSKYWLLGFPPTTRELSNIDLYMRDVASLTTSQGNPVRHDIGIFFWQYGYFCQPPTGQTSCSNATQLPVEPGTNQPVSQATYITRMHSTYRQVLDKANVIHRADGTPAVTEATFGGEFTLLPLQNGTVPASQLSLEWFLSSFWPDFKTYAGARGIASTIEVIPGANDATTEYVAATNSCRAITPVTGSFVDSVYPQLTNHLSMYWPFRTFQRIKELALPLPDKVSLSFFLSPSPASANDLGEYQRVADRVLDDADAVLPTLLARSRVKYGITQSFYGRTTALRSLFGSGFAPQFSQTNSRRLTSSFVWTSPISTSADPCTGLWLAQPVSAATDMFLYAPTP